MKMGAHLVHLLSFACYLAMISLPSPALLSNTALTAAPVVPCCVWLHSVISLLTVGMLSVFVSPFSFFMHSTALRRSSASPANSSMFSCTLLPCFHSVSYIVALPSHLHCLPSGLVLVALSQVISSDLLEMFPCAT